MHEENIRYIQNYAGFMGKLHNFVSVNSICPIPYQRWKLTIVLVSVGGLKQRRRLETL